MNLDVNLWKSFKISEIFSKLKLKKYSQKSQMIEENNFSKKLGGEGHNYISTSSLNNGSIDKTCN